MVKNEETLGEALSNFTNIRRLLQGSALKESGIFLKPTKVGSKGKGFSSFALPLRRKKDREIGRQGMAA